MMVPAKSRMQPLALSWLAYATYYLGRKGFSVVKASVARQYAIGAEVLAAIDTGYLVAYALGQVPSGVAADRWGPRAVIVGGLLLSAAACLGAGAATGVLVIAGCFALNGLAQASGWPATTKVVSHYTGAGDRGRVMGIWSTCYQVGGIAATALASWLLARAGWRSVFQVPAALMVVVALLLAVLLRVRRGGEPSSEHAAGQTRTRRQLRAALASPLLYRYGACYFCVKLIRYSLLFWLPYYLHVAAGFAEVDSGYMSTAFEIGGTAGSAGLGYLSDRSARPRAHLAAASLLGSAIVLALYAGLGQTAALWHVACLALVGALLFGPDALISGAAAQEAAGDASAATAVGLVNGLGSVGALLQGALTVSIERAFGWQALLYVFVVLSVAAALLLLPVGVRPVVAR